MANNYRGPEDDPAWAGGIEDTQPNTRSTRRIDRHPPIRPRKKSRKRLWIILAIIAVVVAGCTAAALSTAGSTTTGPVSSPAGGTGPAVAPDPNVSSDVQEDAGAPNTTPAEVDPTLTYEVTGKGQATVSYTTNSGQSQETVKLPWKFDVPNAEAGFPILSASKTASGAGSIQCIIKRDGKQIASTKASGQFANCTANAELFE
jgi:hypothetical protein